MVKFNILNLSLQRSWNTGGNQSTNQRFEGVLDHILSLPVHSCFSNVQCKRAQSNPSRITFINRTFACSKFSCARSHRADLVRPGAIKEGCPMRCTNEEISKCFRGTWITTHKRQGNKGKARCLRKSHSFWAQIQTPNKSCLLGPWPG